jgi:YVTN family beta-propeller protein
MITETGLDIFIPSRRLNESLPLRSRILVFSFLLLIGLSNECYAQAYAYISNSSDNTVSVIDVSDNTIAATVDVGGGPWGIVIGADGNYVYVANSADGTVSVIDTATFGVTETVTVGAGPFGVTVSPSGDYVYVTNNTDNTVSVIDVSDNTVAAIVDVGGSPWGIAIGADGNYVYVANNADDTVSVIDTATFEVIATITVGAGPLGVTVALRGDYVYVTNNVDNTVSVINVSDNTVAATVDVGGGPWGIVIGADGNYVYVANNADDTVSVIDTTTFEVTETITVGAGPLGIALTFDGGEYLDAFVYVANNTDDTVTVINIVDNSVLTNINIGNSPVALGNFIGGLAPQPPSDLDSDTESDTEISLSWSYNFTDAAGFILERKLGSAGTFSEIADLSLDVTSYRDRDLNVYRTYYYRIAAYNVAGLSDYAEASSTTDKSEGCFIATAAYGSCMAEEVKILKNFRDNVLLTNSLGKSFVNFYYKISPPVADFIAKYDSLRAVVRWSVLPLLGVSWLALKLGPVPALALIFLMITLICTAVLAISRKVRLKVHKI